MTTKDKDQAEPQADQLETTPVSEGGRTSWEEPKLPFCESIKKNWRQMIVHLWGPAGSLVFHVFAIGALLVLTTVPNKPEVISEPIFIDVKEPQDLDKPIKTEKQEVVKPPEQEKVIDNPTGVSDLPNPNDADAPGVGQDSPNDTGIGSDDNSHLTGFDISVVRSRLVMKGLYAHRTKKGRDSALRTYGDGGAGGKATEQAVLRALRWLKKNQKSDGSWEGTGTPAMTAMALLCYLAHDETTRSEEFGGTVKKAVDWFIANQNANGRFNGTDGNEYSHPIGAYAVCEAYAIIQHPALKDVAVKAIAEVVKGQHASGGFNYKLEALSERNDTSYMAWCCQALKAAKMAGLESDVPGLDAAVKRSIAGFKQNAGQSGGFGYAGRGSTGLSGAGALCLQLLGVPKDQDVVNTITFLEPCTFSFDTPDKQPYGGGSQVYYWYYITQAKFQYSPETFAAWNKQFSPELCKRQKVEKDAIADKDGKMVDIGYWKSPCAGEHTGGVVQDTALCCLMLEVYYRYLPSFKKSEELPVDATSLKKTEEVHISIK